jgi:O-antigen ligase
VRDVHLADDAGHEMLLNGDFGLGMDRWIFTDDSHISWRMLNEYLMLWFETGLTGVVAFLALAGLAIAGGIRATWYGAVTGAAVAGSVAGFLVSGMFDNVLEAPRLATLFFLVCLCGLVQWEDRRHRPRLDGFR